MSDKIVKSQLIIPVYINEKIVLDMLAIIDDGFSMVSQVNIVNQHESGNAQKAATSLSTSSTLLGKLLKIDVNGEIEHNGSAGQTNNTTKEKVHTNVSLLSKFRKVLEREGLLQMSFDVSKIQIGDFIEVEGELQKNPLIDCMDHFMDVFRMAEVFSEPAELGAKKAAGSKKAQDSKTTKQMQNFTDELKHSGTVDFVLTDKKGTVVLSAQEQYLSNDNISELIGGRFKVLGKVIAVRKTDTESIDLLRKTSLSILNGETLSELFSMFASPELSQFNLPKLTTKIDGPAVIVIPIAIYA